MAQDKEEYQREQDKIRNFNIMGGDSESIMAGEQEANFMGTVAEENFKAELANPGTMVMQKKFKSPSQNFKAYQDFQDRLANKYKYKGRTLEDQMAIDAAREEGRQETNAARISETAKAKAKAEADKMAKYEEMLKEEEDAAPGEWLSPRTWFHQTKEEVAGWNKQSAQGSYKSKADVQAAYDAKKITAKQAQAEYAKFK